MIYFDCETSGLIKNLALPLAQQPYIIELGAVKTDNQGTELEEFSCLIKPPIPIEPVITKITGITNEQLAAEGMLFVEAWGALAAFFLGEREMLAHNAAFDHSMLMIELSRIGKQYNFPWCSVVIDTMSRYHHKLSRWAQLVKGPDYVQPHRAVNDARLLRDCWFSGIGDE